MTATTVSSIVYGRARAISCVTGVPNWYELPRLRVKMPPRKLMYCCQMGTLSPSFSR